jgi:hypothetical protein
MDRVDAAYARLYADVYGVRRFRVIAGGKAGLRLVSQPRRRAHLRVVRTDHG